jgi:succinate-semialdehyde dehydrogenase/glutarate-semialdehyde dehydrogenase
MRGFAATFSSIDAPMGGMKNSGLGRREGGRYPTVCRGSVGGYPSGIPIAPSHGLDGKSFTSAMTGALRVMKKTGRA